MSHATHAGGHQHYQNHHAQAQPPKRPATITELAERAMIGLWDDTRDFKLYLRQAERYRKHGKECAKRGDYEEAFVEFARAATLVLEKLPSHKDYHTVLSATQRHNLALNGQDILDSLSDLKPTLLDRYDKWVQKHGDPPDQDRTPNARTQKIPNEDDIRAHSQAQAQAQARAQAQAYRDSREEEERREREREQEAKHREEQLTHARMQEELGKWQTQRAQASAEGANQSRRIAPPTSALQDLTFSKTPMQNTGYGSASTMVISDGQVQEQMARHHQQQQQQEMRSREEEIMRQKRRQEQQEGIARRQREAELAERQQRQSFGTHMSPYPTNNVGSSTPTPRYPHPPVPAPPPLNMSTTPQPHYPKPGPSPVEYPSLTPRPPPPQTLDQQNGYHESPYVPMVMPLENPSRYEADSTDSEALHYHDYRRGKHKAIDHHNKSPQRNLRGPAFFTPITTTSPAPDSVGPIRYPNLMSQHQRSQGYYPSLGSMFSDSTDRHVASSSVLFGGPSDTSSLRSAPLPAYGSSNGSSYPRPPTIPAEILPPSAPPTQAEMDRIIRVSDPKKELTPPLKQVNFPRECLPRFLAIAKVNTELNRETCGLLLGKDKGHKYAVTTLLIPKQRATSDTCTMEEEELVLQFTEERNLITLGWIHTHPSQSCFMSSVDLHTHSGFQRMLPESFAVVCAPKSNPNFGIFRLTDPPGLQIILDCTAKDAFHPHPDQPIYTDADKGHVQMKDSSVEIVDLR